MGGLEVRNKSLRCERCLDIKRLTIIPEYPEPILKMECRCSDKNSKLFEFLNEYKKKEHFIIKCTKCQSLNPKEPKYCYKCQKIYCTKCSDFHEQLSNIDTDKENNELNDNDNNDVFASLGHKAINVGNFDYQCIIHNEEKYAGFCKKCSLNICQKCINENIHKDHDVSIFSEILLDKNKKEIIKGCLSLSHDKISHNEKICKKIKKKIKNEDNKKLISTLLKENKKINESILEFFEIMYDIYEKSKFMNYSIIFNARKNTSFNVRKLNFEKKDNEEQDAIELIEYLKNDFILETDYSRKKREEEKKQENNKEDNNNSENKEKEDNNVLINDSNVQSKSIEDNKNINEIVEIIEEKENKTEEKKEEEKQEEIKKEEIKKEEIKKVDSKNEEFKKEILKQLGKKDLTKDKEKKEVKKDEIKEVKKEEKKEEIKEIKKEEKKEVKEEEKKEDIKKKDNNIKKTSTQPLSSVGAKAALFKKMMEAKGGGMIGKPLSETKNSTGNTEKSVKIEQTKNEGNTVELLNNIKITKVAKKKPRKINFE